MPSLPNMNLIVPTDHGDAGVWDTILDATFALIDEHDHTTGKGVPIPAAALDIDADVPWNSGGSYYAITGIKALDFQPVSTSLVSSYAGALFVNSADNNLYYRTTGGTNVKIIDGTTLNVSAFAGGIGGDYSAIGALLDYDDATDTYRFRQETSAGVRQYAKAKHADLSLYEYIAAGGAVVPTNAVTLKSPSSLAAPYSLTMPAALPSTTTELFFSSAGVGTFAAPQRTMLIPAIGGISSAAYGTISGTAVIRTGASGGTYYRPIELDAGHRIVNIRVRLKDSAGTTCTALLISDTDGTPATVATIGTSAGSGAYQTLTASAVNATLATGKQYLIAYTFGGAAANCDLNKIEIDYDRP